MAADAFGFWVIASVIWVVALTFLSGLLGIDPSPWTAEAVDGIIPTDVLKLALLLAGPVVTFVLFFVLRWGGTTFSLWPRPVHWARP